MNGHVSEITPQTGAHPRGELDQTVYQAAQQKQGSDELLSFFMGKNTPERQDFIIGNLKIEKDLIEA